MTSYQDRCGQDGAALAESLAGLRPTRQRKAVVRVLVQAEVFLSAHSVHEALHRSGAQVGLSTIYRSLQALSQRGMIDAIRGDGGQMLYRKCADQPHDHLVCRRCGAAVEIPGEAIRRLVEHWANAVGFADVEHALKAFGTCPKCLKEPQ